VIVVFRDLAADRLRGIFGSSAGRVDVDDRLAAGTRVLGRRGVSVTLEAGSVRIGSSSRQNAESLR